MPDSFADMNSSYSVVSTNKYFLRYKLLSTTFGPVRTTDRQQNTDSNTYEPTIQIAQVAKKIAGFLNCSVKLDNEIGK